MKIALLFLFGAILGTVVNWAIYQLCYFGTRRISPFGPRDPKAKPRQLVDYVPILGWLFIRRDEGIHGRLFWVRPMLIELGLAVFTVWFYYWQLDGGLIAGRLPPRGGDAELWFASHLLLIVLLTAATFIDFDEQTIPDAITIPGTLAGLGLAAFFPAFRLPEVVIGPNYESIHFHSPESLAEMTWIHDWGGLAVGLFIIFGWAIALMPKICTLRYGLFQGARIMWASMIRPARKTVCKIRTQNRGPSALMYGFVVLGISVSAFYAWFWSVQGPGFESLLGSVLGMAFAGGLIWGVRLLAGLAMGQEAMGFGDVTLMVMVGAFLGWQATLPIFFYAPFAGVAVGAFQFLFTKNRAFPFGPYLAVATVYVVLRWPAVWEYMLPYYAASMRYVLFSVIIGSLVLLPVLMLGMRALRGPDPDEDT
ncbi:MAG: A24 family peptidase [Pirellulaceae bacterium]